jgi:prepilin-type N-terminal cleavage/methylation domain-containing protein
MNKFKIVEIVDKEYPFPSRIKIGKNEDTALYARVDDKKEKTSKSATGFRYFIDSDAVAQSFVKILDKSGFSLLEVLMALIVITISATIFMKVQQFSTIGVGSSDRSMIAGQMIEEQIESVRKSISLDTNYFNNTFQTNSVGLTNNGITITWKVFNSNTSPAVHVLRGSATWAAPPNTPIVYNIDSVEFKTKWFNNVADSLVVTTYIAKNF